MIRAYCDEHQIGTASLDFDLRPSEEALPTLVRQDLDLLLIDGAHSFPIPVIDWFYGAAHLRRGGVVVFDDVNLPAVQFLLDGFVERDPRWQRVAGTDKWRAFRRLSDGPLVEHESAQSFYVMPSSRWDRAIRDVKGALPLNLRRMARRIVMTDRP